MEVVHVDLSRFQQSERLIKASKDRLLAVCLWSECGSFGINDEGRAVTDFSQPLLAVHVNASSVDIFDIEFMKDIEKCLQLIVSHRTDVV